jgi:hypothetical protein
VEDQALAGYDVNSKSMESHPDVLRVVVRMWMGGKSGWTEPAISVGGSPGKCGREFGLNDGAGSYWSGYHARGSFTFRHPCAGDVSPVSYPVLLRSDTGIAAVEQPSAKETSAWRPYSGQKETGNGALHPQHREIVCAGRHYAVRRSARSPPPSTLPPSYERCRNGRCWCRRG